MHAIELRKISKTFGTTSALVDVDLQMEHGERLVLVGCSGAGKTTLLRVLAGLEEADQGSVWLDGQDVSRRPARARGVAMVSQDYALYPQLTVLQNLTTALSPLKLPRPERDERIGEALQWFRIESLTDRLPSELSGGQAQRVAFAKAIVRRPTVLLLDEPLSQMDGILREEIRDLIVQASRRYAMSLVMVTHDPVDAMRIASHIAILDRGEIVRVGTSESVYHDPQCRIAGDLLSPFGMNWIDLAAEETENDVGWLATFVGSRADELVGFRPEDVRVVDSQADLVSQPGLAFSATVSTVQSLGFATLLLAEMGGRTVRILLRERVPESGTMRFHVAESDCIWIRRHDQSP